MRHTRSKHVKLVVNLIKDSVLYWLIERKRHAESLLTLNWDLP